MTAHPRTLDHLFGSRLRARLLAWLFLHPGERYFVRRLAAILGEDSTNLSRELARLAEVGIIAVDVEGRQKYYHADPSSVLYPELRGLVAKTAGLADRLRDALAPVAGRIEVAFVFGSVAAGTERVESDIDLLVVSDLKLGDLVTLLSPLQLELGREINPVVYPPAELREKLASGHHFVEAVVNGSKLFVLGSQDELERLVEVRLAPTGTERRSSAPLLLRTRMLQFFRNKIGAPKWPSPQTQFNREEPL